MDIQIGSRVIGSRVIVTVKKPIHDLYVNRIGRVSNIRTESDGTFVVVCFNSNSGPEVGWFFEQELEVVNLIRAV